MKTMNEIKSEINATWTGFTIRTKAKVREAYVWACNNKEELAVLVGVGTAAINGGMKIYRVVDRKHDLNKEQKLKDRYVYDRSLGIYHELKHKLRPEEVQEIDRRRRNGESYVKILTDMRLMK